MRLAPLSRPQLRSPSVPLSTVAQPRAVVTPQLTAEQTRARAEQYFAAFQAKDVATLKSLYRPDATFKDNMFDLSDRAAILKMWSSAPPFEKFDAKVISATPGEVRAKWTVDYEIFGNQVHNEIDSLIRFDANGRITEQRESWDESKWMSQALPHIPKWAQGATYHLMRPVLSWQMEH